ncbi:TetR/AcrR family transcriptional regulator [Bacteriovorax sp. Seq25_V]|uniref:TetR/AcrR family transcriptional regulator n=1 Tax=Bacteriovorax sp. Seq25_V TaxID=1201288 RepID=UPI000389E783|nr:TetR/AcrR family transcriptional regulator [Bacteriovorax sp. Seq25_V]EQC46592.1 transcriptional regulator, TetR family [Bacteriovorax sp. Seq25_V]
MDTKEKIITIATKILTNEGHKSLTTARLVEETGISKGGIYHHFESIDEIFFTVAKNITSELTMAFSELEFKDINHFHSVLIDFAFDDFQEQKVLYSSLLYFISNTSCDDKYKGLLQEWLNNSIEEWANVYAKKFNIKISKSRLDEVCRMIDMHFCGLVVHRILIEDCYAYKKTTKTFFKMIMAEYFS